MKSRPAHSVHESSYIDDGVDIGEETCIWHFCHVLTGSRIGAHCRIGQNVVIGPRVEIGDNVKIQNNVSVYEGVRLEDDVFCGPSMVFTNIATPRSAFPRNRSEDNLSTHVKRGASIGANATIICGNTIGEHADRGGIGRYQGRPTLCRRLRQSREAKGLGLRMRYRVTFLRKQCSVHRVPAPISAEWRWSSGVCPGGFSA